MSVRHFVKCHVNRARVLIGWQLPTHVCQSFTRQIRVYQHEEVGEKVGENRGKFYLSLTVCQRVCWMFLYHSHTPTWVFHHEFAVWSPLYVFADCRNSPRGLVLSVRGSAAKTKHSRIKGSLNWVSCGYQWGSQKILERPLLSLQEDFKHSTVWRFHFV